MRINIRLHQNCIKTECMVVTLGNYKYQNWQSKNATRSMNDMIVSPQIQALLVTPTYVPAQSSTHHSNGSR